MIAKCLTFRRWLCAALLMAASGHTLAAISVTGVKVNGAATATVATSAPLNVEVTVELSLGTRWRATEFTTTPASSLKYCVIAPDINANGTFVRPFPGIPAPDKAGLYSINVQAFPNPNCKGGDGSNVAKLADAITTYAPTGLNHVRVLHDGAALTCARETLTLKACADASCGTLFTGDTSVTLGNVGTWTANPVTISGGTATVGLNNSTAGTVTLAGSVGSPAAATTALQCSRNGTVGDCSLVFSNGSCSFDAVEAGKAGNTPIYTKRIGAPLSLDVLALNAGVLNALSTQTVEATLVDGTATGCGTTARSPPVSFTYSSADQGRRAVTFVPTSAARDVRVQMKSGSVVQCSSDNFAIRPAAFAVTGVTGVGGADADAAGASVTAAPKLKAGTDAFTLNAAAGAGYNGAPVIDSGLLKASQGNAGVLSGAFGTASGGTASGAGFRYTEVGYFRILPFGVYDTDFAAVDQLKSPAECFSDANLGGGAAPADPNAAAADGRLGCYFGNAATAYFGRFIPDHFALGVPAIDNRSALVPACPASAFTYMGEPFSTRFTLTAQNAANDPTVNYAGAFARLDPASQLGIGVINEPTPPATLRTPLQACPAAGALPCYTPAPVTGSFSAGAVDVVAPLTVSRGTAAAGPFDNVKVGIAPVDPDGVRIATYNIDTANLGSPNHALVGTTAIRYGRLNIDSAYGSELLPLTIKVAAQYWNGKSYATNVLDSCTPVSAIAMDTYLDGINIANLPASKLSGAGLASGIGKLVLRKPDPVPAKKGSVMLRSPFPYLPGSGRATFGVYKSGPVIYTRESY